MCKNATDTILSLKKFTYFERKIVCIISNKIRDKLKIQFYAEGLVIRMGDLGD